MRKATAEQNNGDELTVPWACPVPVPSSLHIPVCTCTVASLTMGTRLLPSVSVLLILRLQAMMTLPLFLLSPLFFKQWFGLFYLPLFTTLQPTGSPLLPLRVFHVLRLSSC